MSVGTPRLGAPARRMAPAAMQDRPSWREEGADWPGSEFSRFVEAGGLRWHVQDRGQGPPLLLIHGTGAATHSWRDLAPLLARHFRVVAPDLPGHGFTALPPAPGLTLPGMARSVASLLARLEASPQLVVGHSAGAAVLARMCLDGLIRPRRLIALNGALLPLRGAAGQLFSPLARLLVANSLVPRLFAWRAGDPRAVERLLQGTGSRIDARGARLYRRLLRHPGHVAGALGMMASWELDGLARDLPRLDLAVTLVVGGNDRTISPVQARRLQALLPSADVVRLSGLGHLAHEERPQEVAALIVRRAVADGLVTA